MTDKTHRPSYVKRPTAAFVSVAQECGYAAAFVYAVLSSFYNPKEPEKFCPFLSTLAARAGMPESTVRTHLAALKAKGFVESQAQMRKEGRGRTSDLYWFPEAATKCSESEQVDSATNRPESEQVVAGPSARNSHDQVLEKPATKCSESEQDGTSLTPYEPPKNPSSSSGPSGAPMVLSLSELAPNCEEVEDFFSKLSKARQTAFTNVLTESLEAAGDPAPVTAALVKFNEQLRDRGVGEHDGGIRVPLRFLRALLDEQATATKDKRFADIDRFFAEEEAKTKRQEQEQRDQLVKAEAAQDLLLITDDMAERFGQEACDKYFKEHDWGNATQLDVTRDEAGEITSRTHRDFLSRQPRKPKDKPPKMSDKELKAYAQEQRRKGAQMLREEGAAKEAAAAAPEPTEKQGART